MFDLPEEILGKQEEPSTVEIGNNSVTHYASGLPQGESFDLGGIQLPKDGMEGFLTARKPVTATRKKIAKIGDLSGFLRVSAETLVHKSDRDLWAIKKEADGLVIERLFDDAGEPLKG